MSGHRLVAVTSAPLHPAEVILVTVATANGALVRRCSCGAAGIWLGRDMEELTALWADHARQEMAR